MKKNTPTWEEYFYKIALAVGEKSKDKPEVGAVVVSEDHVIVSTGYNGPARNVQDLEERFSDSEGEKCKKCGRGPVKEKLPWMCHAEVNAIVNAARIGVSLMDGTIYVTKSPCVSCANTIVQAGIVRVYTQNLEPWQSDPYDLGDGSRSAKILHEGGVMFHQRPAQRSDAAAFSLKSSRAPAKIVCAAQGLMSLSFSLMRFAFSKVSQGSR